MFRRIATFIVVASITAAPAFAAPSADGHDVAALLHQERVLRERIGQLQLDALVARVEQAMDARRAAHGRTAYAAPAHDLQRDLTLYSY